MKDNLTEHQQKYIELLAHNAANMNTFQLEELFKQIEANNEPLKQFQQLTIMPQLLDSSELSSFPPSRTDFSQEKELLLAFAEKSGVSVGGGSKTASSEATEEVAEEKEVKV